MVTSPASFNQGHGLARVPQRERESKQTQTMLGCRVLWYIPSGPSPELCGIPGSTCNLHGQGCVVASQVRKSKEVDSTRGRSSFDEVSAVAEVSRTTTRALQSMTVVRPISDLVCQLRRDNNRSVREISRSTYQCCKVEKRMSWSRSL